jgi:hypothetical protein
MFKNYVLANRIEATGAYEVFCVDCRKSIGTMTPGGVQRAILVNRARGGIKCPDCRKNSCARCGWLLEGNGEDTQIGRICKICELEDDGLIVAKNTLPLSS